jgi:hypothetical protein
MVDKYRVGEDSIGVGGVTTDTEYNEHNIESDTNNSGHIPTIAGRLSEAEDNGSIGGGSRKKPRRVLHFSDGVLEEYSTEEEEETEETDTTSKAVVDPRSLTWAPWLYWRAWSAGGNVVTVLDSVGEKLAWWMGITSPKYYYEIQEAIRMKEEEEKRKLDQDAEMAGWQDQAAASPAQPRATQPASYQSTAQIPSSSQTSISYQSTSDAIQ